MPLSLASPTLRLFLAWSTASCASLSCLPSAPPSAAPDTLLLETLSLGDTGTV
eukprot:CAMPEP_0173407590 /NCGR_PEP_ID=MMETSP1356-20130122/67607_1 /TAXON_ID=77927 ORGANISM="Hemiselmis virescens, Strain PCC157" /NCGR_SAMPLE_ID=MMETSP1356 /ASSEMBLY_ACC=CAM_ASM_000847 /LENGTH=52 /DNA_ID=CAMNT_0014368797 /DNA_START=122 /DNA_END=277 /DNA_ORIENTATION=+